MHFLGFPIHVVIRRLALPAELHDDIGTGALRFLLENLAYLRMGLGDGWIDTIVVSTEQKRIFLADLGIESTFLPVGQQEAFGHPLGLKRDIDLLFIGNIKSRRRRRALNQVFAEVRKKGLTACRPDKPIHGEERTRLVNRARVMLNIYNYPWDTPWMRWNLAVANGAVVASEPLSIAWPLRPGTDFLSASIDDLPGEIVALVANEERRRDMLENCRTRLDQEMNLEGTIGRLCRVLDSSLPRRENP